MCPGSCTEPLLCLCSVPWSCSSLLGLRACHGTGNLQTILGLGWGFFWLLCLFQRAEGAVEKGMCCTLPAVGAGLSQSCCVCRDQSSQGWSWTCCCLGGCCGWRGVPAPPAPPGWGVLGLWDCRWGWKHGGQSPSAADFPCEPPGWSGPRLPDTPELKKRL